MEASPPTCESLKHIFRNKVLNLMRLHFQKEKNDFTSPNKVVTCETPKKRTEKFSKFVSVKDVSGYFSSSSSVSASGLRFWVTSLCRSLRP